MHLCIVCVCYLSLLTPLGCRYYFIFPDGTEASKYKNLGLLWFPRLYSVCYVLHVGGSCEFSSN